MIGYCENCKKEKEVRRLKVSWQDFSRKYNSGIHFIHRGFYYALCKKCLSKKVKEIQK